MELKESRVLSFFMVDSYTIIAMANGYVMGYSPTESSPFVVWQTDDDSNGVCCGHYFVDREEAEWDFCARAFEWFEDNMYIHMIEDKLHEQNLIGGLKSIRKSLDNAAQIVDEMCAEVDKLRGEHNDNNKH